MDYILYPVGINFYPVDISCGEHASLIYPLENISCGERRPQDISTGYTTHYILWVYPVGVSEFYRCGSKIGLLHDFKFKKYVLVGIIFKIKS